MSQTESALRPDQRSLSLRLPRFDLATAALGIVLIATTYLRLTIGAHDPLWLDETWTGMIASQRSLDEFWRQVYYDSNAPLFYIIARIWAVVAGVSNEALRMPAAFFGILSPLVALIP